MSLYTELEEIKKERRNGLQEEFKNICKRIIDIFADDKTINSVRIENYIEDERITISDSKDDEMCIDYIDYGSALLYYALGFYDLETEEMLVKTENLS